MTENKDEGGTMKIKPLLRLSFILLPSSFMLTSALILTDQCIGSGATRRNRAQQTRKVQNWRSWLDKSLRRGRQRVVARSDPLGVTTSLIRG